MFKKISKEKQALDNNHDHFNEDETESDQEGTASKSLFKYKWLKLWLWMRYDEDLDAVFCTSETYAIAGNSPYAKEGCKNLKTSSFYEHSACKTHLIAEAKKADALKAKKPIVEVIHKVHDSADGAVLNLFRAAYTIAARNWSFNDFEHVINLLEISGCASITRQLYHNDHACHEFICCISESLHSSLVEKVKASPFFGLQVDESTDIASQQHIVLCISYLEDGSEPKRNFRGILRVKEADAGSLFDALLNYLQHVGFDLSKLVAFGSDVASTMTDKNNGVAAGLEQRLPFLTHCANLAVVDASKEASMEWLQEIESLVNAIAAHPATVKD